MKLGGNMEISGALLADIYNLMLLVAVFAFISKNSNKDREQWFKYLIIILFLSVIAKLMSECPINGGISDTISLIGT